MIVSSPPHISCALTESAPTPCPKVGPTWPKPINTFHFPWRNHWFRVGHVTKTSPMRVNFSTYVQNAGYKYIHSGHEEESLSDDLVLEIGLHYT